MKFMIAEVYIRPKGQNLKKEKEKKVTKVEKELKQRKAI